jgi:isoquinoline 1-oxidoreductase beta subunit
MTKTIQNTVQNPVQNLSRRNILRGIAGSGAFVLGVSVSAKLSMPAALGAMPTAPGAKSLTPSVWLSIAPSGEVTIVVSRSEMGQGIRTGLPQVLADELEADWDRIKIEQALGDAKYGDQDTDGSRSVRQFYHVMREAGATARTMLEQAAAEVWKVDVSKVYAKNHEVRRKGSRKRLSYGELASVAAKLDVPAIDTLKLKDAKDFRYIGKGKSIVDLGDITSGKAAYGGDIRLPGMKHAVVARCRVVGGTVKSYDPAAALGVAGVEQVIQLAHTPGPVAFNPLGGIAVIASNTWAAIEGRKKLVIEWDEGANASYTSSDYKVTLEKSARAKGRQVRREGDFEAASAAAAKNVTADYYVPHLIHAPMEPPCAIADVKADSCDVWACTQNPQLIAQIAMGVLQLKPEQVRSHTTLLGGAFGRKSKPDFVVEAILLSKQVGAPVQVMWTREDEIQHGYYHTVGASHMEATLDEDDKVSGWLHRAAMPSILSTFMPDPRMLSDFEVGMGMIDLPYDIPNIQLENGEAAAHVRIGWLRAVVNIPMAFAVCSFADEIANARGKDPVENLLDLVGPARHVEANQDDARNENYDEPLDKFPIDTGRLANVIKIAARKARWGKKLPKGHALGIAAHRSFLTYVATVVEVKIDDDGTISIPKVHMAVDCGRVVNPDRVKSQMEGAAVFGTSLALYGEITATNGAIDQSNFHDYPMTRMSAAPHVEVELVRSDELPSGIGEPGVPPFAPALCNAIFAATGKRIRSLPIGESV